MLILARHVHQRIIIALPDGRRIIVTLIETRGPSARLGFDADRDIIIHREEVVEAIEEARKQKEQ